MKFYTKIPKRLKYFYLRELVQYKWAFRQGDFIHAWHHLERAHIIGQAYPYEHSYAHWLMLKFGIAVKDAKEILGSCPACWLEVLNLLWERSLWEIQEAPMFRLCGPCPYHRIFRNCSGNEA
jgi:hypothetical protein